LINLTEPGDTGGKEERPEKKRKGENFVEPVPSPL